MLMTDVHSRALYVQQRRRDLCRAAAPWWWSGLRADGERTRRGLAAGVARWRRAAATRVVGPVAGECAQAGAAPR